MSKILKGFRFRVFGMPDSYEVVKIEDEHFIVKMDNLNKNYPILKKDFEEALSQGNYIPINQKNNKSNDGMNCSKCNTYSAYAQANQDDGKTFICYSCRNRP